MVMAVSQADGRNLLDGASRLEWASRPVTLVDGFLPKDFFDNSLHRDDSLDVFVRRHSYFIELAQGYVRRNLDQW